MESLGSAHLLFLPHRRRGGRWAGEQGGEGRRWEPTGERQLSEAVLPVAGRDNPVAGPGADAAGAGCGHEDSGR